MCLLNQFFVCVSGCWVRWLRLMQVVFSRCWVSQFGCKVSKWKIIIVKLILISMFWVEFSRVVRLQFIWLCGVIRMMKWIVNEVVVLVVIGMVMFRVVKNSGMFIVRQSSGKLFYCGSSYWLISIVVGIVQMMLCRKFRLMVIVLLWLVNRLYIIVVSSIVLDVVGYVV